MDDLTTGLAKAKRTPWLTRSTGIMLGLVIACAGFLAGVKVQQAYGSTGTTPSRAGTGNAVPGFGNRGQGQQGTGQQGTGQQASATPVSGKVKLVDGTTVYIETADGTLITVKTTATTVVQTAKTVTLKDLAVGTEVRILGTSAGTETLSATAITATAP
ncbi:hypothetical protein Rhe02_87340 [Rhizocola hellebori]|uniref:DUF5666 domain-containing protein n=1 Tax=Rhizocola hellebori TaxID=1392758 RepID=A0A8J3QIJ5_9ACTN|nr:hypothetical protein [Rhizocola hellebori]GIH10667.1 hypothetical protein Rhe02_87340 [Rhizocola hellebori]